jgi:predicted alpha/beta-hydrolase family hydrolase
MGQDRGAEQVGRRLGHGRLSRALDSGHHDQYGSARHGLYGGGHPYRMVGAWGRSQEMPPPPRRDADPPTIITGMARRRPAGLIVTPGAGAGRDQSGLVAIDEAVSAIGLAVERVEFPSQAAGKRRTDPPAVCIETIRTATSDLADRLGVATGRVAIGGRSFGGRMCSMAAAEGLKVAALVLVSYPLHPPGKPDRLRTAHFPDLHLPCLFVSGRRDAFGSPEELERETKAISGPVTHVFVDGDHSLGKSEGDVADIVAAWLESPA